MQAIGKIKQLVGLSLSLHPCLMNYPWVGMGNWELLYKQKYNHFVSPVQELQFFIVFICVISTSNFFIFWGYYWGKGWYQLTKHDLYARKNYEHSTLCRSYFMSKIGIPKWISRLCNVHTELAKSIMFCVLSWLRDVQLRR